MACFQPLIAVNYNISYDGKFHNTADGKQHIKILFQYKNLYSGVLKELRERYGKSLMFLPCNHCVACARDYSRMWQARIMCEYEYHDKACFLTLTYKKDRKPNKTDLRKFIKAVRKEFGVGIKFFGCGECGEQTGRFHNHLILFGVDFSEDREIFGKRGLHYTYISKKLDSLWKHGFALIGDLDIDSAGYVSKYCDKKKISGLNEGEFVIMSRGLGKQYYLDHKDKLLDSDYIYFKGNKFKLPRYFLKLFDKENFYYQALADDYKSRKRDKANYFRYDKCRSVTSEEEGLVMQENIDLMNKLNKEAIRDVGIY